jgi:hypothetical protein
MCLVVNPIIVRDDVDWVSAFMCFFIVPCSAHQITVGNWHSAASWPTAEVDTPNSTSSSIGALEQTNTCTWQLESPLPSLSGVLHLVRRPRSRRRRLSWVPGELRAPTPTTYLYHLLQMGCPRRVETPSLLTSCPRTATAKLSAAVNKGGVVGTV